MSFSSVSIETNFSPEISSEEINTSHISIDPSVVQGIGFLTWCKVALLAILFAAIIRSTIIETFKIPSDSMFPTIAVGDHLIVSKLSYDLSVPSFAKSLWKGGEPKRGDVIVFFLPSTLNADGQGKYYVKRIVALPGDKVSMHKGDVWVNGVNSKTYIPITEKALVHGRVPKAANSLLLEQNEFFVMGDNRDNSVDSRYFGPIKSEDVVGKALLVYWSWVPASKDVFASSDKGEVLWSRIGEKLF